MVMKVSVAVVSNCAATTVVVSGLNLSEQYLLQADLLHAQVAAR
jgi:hypothetical protein